MERFLVLLFAFMAYSEISFSQDYLTLNAREIKNEYVKNYNGKKDYKVIFEDTLPSIDSVRRFSVVVKIEDKEMRVRYFLSDVYTHSSPTCIKLIANLTCDECAEKIKKEVLFAKRYRWLKTKSENESDYYVSRRKFRIEKSSSGRRIACKTMQVQHSNNKSTCTTIQMLYELIPESMWNELVRGK